ncbi:hypothetical protein J1614_008531 [Plenodomus biglobosus]|nr:hypothetical protein J1614_008531 [Plenodomus biglobosus]
MGRHGDEGMFRTHEAIPMRWVHRTVLPEASGILQGCEPDCWHRRDSWFPYIGTSTPAPGLKMSTSDDEADLKRALAMSLDIDSTDDEDEHLRQAIALSLQETKQRGLSRSPGGSSKHVTIQVEQPDPPPNVVTASTSAARPSHAFGGVDRKAMEEERLARLSKRKRISSPELPTKRLAKASDGGQRQPNKTASQTLPMVGSQYFSGTIKRTFATKYPRTNDITIDELLEASSVHTAVISSFMWDVEWLQEKLNPVKVKQIWVMNAKGKEVQDRWVQEMRESGVPNLKLHFPPMNGMIYNMHSKFLLLFGKDKLRFAVPTANMTRIDWGEVANDWQPGVMENSVFLIDLPRLRDGVTANDAKLTRFGTELIYFLERQGTPRNVIDGVLSAGAHKVDAAHPTGLAGVAQAIRDLQLGDVKHLEIDYAASSIGAVNDSFLQRIHLAARGIDFDEKTQPASVRNNFRIYFPTKETVEKSIGGADCGGIISLPRTYYNAPTFPRECFRDYDSTRQGMLSHNKLLFARGCKNTGARLAWVYIGSANLSESAWGGQKVLKSGSLGSLNIRNWECGVIMSVPEERLRGMVFDEGTVLPPMSVFEDIIEVPFHHPGAGQAHGYLSIGDVYSQLDTVDRIVTPLPTQHKLQSSAPPISWYTTNGADQVPRNQVVASSVQVLGDMKEV